MKDFEQSPLGNDNYSNTLKERFLIVHRALRSCCNASDSEKEIAAAMVFTEDDLAGLEKSLQNPETRGVLTYAKVVSNAAKAVYHTVTSGTLPTSSSTHWYRNVRGEARSTSVGTFWAGLQTLVDDEPILVPSAAQIEEHFISKLRERVHSLALDWARLISNVEHSEFEHKQRFYTTTLRNQDRSISRTKLLEDLRKVLVPDGPSQQVFFLIPFVA
jgi:hypothetical protein